MIICGGSKVEIEIKKNYFKDANEKVLSKVQLKLF